MSHFEDAHKRSRIISAIAVLIGGDLDLVLDTAETAALIRGKELDTTWRPPSCECDRDAGEMCPACAPPELSRPDEPDVEGLVSVVCNGWICDHPDRCEDCP